MKKNFIQKFDVQPAWVILIFDLLCVLLATTIALLLRASVNFPSRLTANLYYSTILSILFIRFIFFVIFKTPNMVVRYTNAKNTMKIIISCLCGTIVLFVINKLSFSINEKHLIPTSIIGMEFFISSVILIIYRFLFKIYYLEMVNPTKYKKNIIIFGAGESGITTKKALDRDTGSKYNVLAFVDESEKLIGKNVESLPVIALSKLSNFLSKNVISFLIISVQNLSPSKKNEITEIALQYNVKVLIVPPVMQWINGELSFKQIKKIKIEDLLERDPIKMDKHKIHKDVINKTIMITGAAGSIGSEIVHQLLDFDFKQLILIDNAETPVFFLYNYCLRHNNLKNIEIIVSDITDKEKMEAVMAQYHPEIIYHAAAYKHVPIMEQNVQSAIKVNVEGTKIMADLAVKYSAIKFVMISTDKAVNPTGVMGASKRIAEIYVQSLNFSQDKTKFITTRFGNVLGSNGSVIPIFREQIENGGPVIVTHPDITRYFMTIPEACQLVITAGVMGKGGEIFIFDMGKAIKIYDLAVKMIKLSGLTLGKDISISFSNLREGEKLYEELLANQENTIVTDHDKIMIAKVRKYEYKDVEKSIRELVSLKNKDEFEIVKKMKDIVPEFLSNNSKFDVLNITASDQILTKK